MHLYIIKNISGIFPIHVAVMQTSLLNRAGEKGELIELMLLFNLLLVKYIYIGVAVAQEVQHSRSAINGLTSACQVSLTKILNAKLLPMLSSEC